MGCSLVMLMTALTASECRLCLSIVWSTFAKVCFLILSGSNQDCSKQMRQLERLSWFRQNISLVGHLSSSLLASWWVKCHHMVTLARSWLSSLPCMVEQNACSLSTFLRSVSAHMSVSPEGLALNASLLYFWCIMLIFWCSLPSPTLQNPMTTLWHGRCSWQKSSVVCAWLSFFFQQWFCNLSYCTHSWIICWVRKETLSEMYTRE